MRGDAGAVMPGHNSPIVGALVACCCARSAAGTAASAPPSAPRNARRLMSPAPVGSSGVDGAGNILLYERGYLAQWCSGPADRTVGHSKAIERCSTASGQERLPI